MGYLTGFTGKAGEYDVHLEDTESGVRIRQSSVSNYSTSTPDGSEELEIGTRTKRNFRMALLQSQMPPTKTD